MLCLQAMVRAVPRLMGLPSPGCTARPWGLHHSSPGTLEHVKGYNPIPVTPASRLILLPISPQVDASSGV